MSQTSTTGIEYLARQLAINHYNSSLSTENPDLRPENLSLKTEKSEKERIKIIFKDNIGEIKRDDNKWHKFGFTRNILIIGAGASKNASSDLLTADNLAVKALEDLGIFKMIRGGRYAAECMYEHFGVNEQLKDKSLEELVGRGESDGLNQQANRFFSDAFKYLDRIENFKITLGELVKELKFEGILQLVQNFVTKRELNLFLRNLLKHKYIPNLFYELVAHLLKHRFIDVVINLNFDEMLDNAIEDEMGDADWIKIYNSATCPKFEKAIVDDRLRIPMYIKPHGTISNLDSILYSRTQYIDLSPEIKEVLDKVFKGINCQENECTYPVQQFNVIAAGYAMEDPDIMAILNENLLRHSDKNESNNSSNTRLFIFDPSPEQCIENLSKRLGENRFGTKTTSTLISKIDKCAGIIKEFKKNSSRNDDESKAVKNLTDDEWKKLKTELSDDTKPKEVIFPYRLRYDLNATRNLNNVFHNLYKDIQQYFNEPFVPSGPGRHLWNTKIINDTYIKEYTKNSENNRKQLFEHRWKANLLFDFYKFNGRLPSNCVFSDRVGKYYQLYLNEFGSQGIKDGLPTTPVKYLKKVFGSDEILDGECFIWHNRFNNACFQPSEDNDELKRKNIKDTIWKQIEKAVKGISSSVDKKTGVEREDFENIPFGGSHEISPSYTDKKHLRFTPFESKHIINSNLSLTWHFFDFVTNMVRYNGESPMQWKTLKMISRTGMAFYNLYTYEEDDFYTKSLKEKGVNALIYHSIKRPSVLEKDTKSNTTKLVCAKAKYESEKIKAEIEDIHPNFSAHKMVLFMKDQKTPVAGIYFFNPANKTRINPVWFNHEQSENLEVLKRLFDDQIRNQKLLIKNKK